MFRPSDYTCLLIEALMANRCRIVGSRVLEIGCGSGVVLASLAGAGAASICGVDIESTAIEASLQTITAAGHLDIAELHQGDMWAPVAPRRFDLIVANLPQFPGATLGLADRLASWSAGGPHGRQWLDRFLAGLAPRLTGGGTAMITHSGFTDIERTRAILHGDGLAVRIAATRLVHLPAEKIRAMTESVRRAALGRTIFEHGGYAFATVHVVEIGAPDRLG
jgi:release factor glutamine methyltransferase